MMEDKRTNGGNDTVSMENIPGPVEITTEDGGTSEDDWAKSGSDEDDLLEITWRMENRGDDNLQQRTSSNPAPCLPGGLEKDEDAKVPDGEPGSTTPVVGVAPPSLSRVVTTTSTVDQRCNVLRRTTNFVIRVVSDSSSEDDTGSGMVDPGHVVDDNGMDRSSPDADIPDFIPATPESSSGRNRTVRQRTGKQLTFSFMNHDVIATGDKEQLEQEEDDLEPAPYHQKLTWLNSSRSGFPLKIAGVFPKIVSILALRVTSIFIGFTNRFFLLFTDGRCDNPM